MLHEENLREHYALTLAQWCRNLVEHWDECVAEVGEGTARVWGLYMAGSRLGFERNEIQLHQVLAATPARRRHQRPPAAAVVERLTPIRPRRRPARRGSTGRPTPGR